MKASLLGFSVLLVAALTAACGGGDQNGANNNTTGTGGTGAGAGGTGANGTGANGTGANGTGANGTGANGTGGNTGGGSTGGGNTGGTGTGGGGPCGGLAGVQCGDDEWCDYADDTCGGDDSAGVCAPKPEACDLILDPVCACDGKSYDNACEAAKAGVDVTLVGLCEAPEGYFSCGPELCDKGLEYCEHQISDVGGVPDSYSCKPKPPNCANNPTCACLSDLPCGNMCELVDGAFTLTCPGG